MRRSTLKYTLVAALAASTMAASTASARQIDRVDRYDSPTSSLAGTTEKQDLRGEYAQDAARLAAQADAQAQIKRGEQTRHAFFLRRRAQVASDLAKQDLRGEHAKDAARLQAQIPSRGTPQVYWSYDYQAPKPSPVTASAPTPKPDGTDTDLWLILAIALGATGIVAGSALAVSRRSHSRVPA
ncbi:MAG TPA: hypothetical protein VFX51_07170 [Solirubrobacteraceae bacterium]|nr:hypothetical protein [Solirubrobacteraceae bacterium]